MLFFKTDKDDLGKKLQTRIDELQAKITAFEQTKTIQSPGNFDFKQKLIESKHYSKVRWSSNRQLFNNYIFG